MCHTNNDSAQCVYTEYNNSNSNNNDTNTRVAPPKNGKKEGKKERPQKWERAKKESGETSTLVVRVRMFLYSRVCSWFGKKPILLLEYMTSIQNKFTQDPAVHWYATFFNAFYTFSLDFTSENFSTKKSWDECRVSAKTDNGF